MMGSFLEALVLFLPHEMSSDGMSFDFTTKMLRHVARFLPKNMDPWKKAASERRLLLEGSIYSLP